MSDLEPPADFDNMGPPTAAAPATGRQSRKPPVANAIDTTDFFEWLTTATTRRELRAMLPDYVDVDQFLATARDAALTNQKLLTPNLRPSLLRAIFKAAKQGLRPDGKEGALVPRYDTETRQYGIVWQPMVWGIVKLGRLTGSIDSIRPVIVFLGEDFDIEEGDTQIYRHTVDRRIVGEAYQALYGGISRTDTGRATLKVNPEDFFDRVDCVYTIIRSKDGTVTKRWMPRERIALIRNQQGLNTPWYGPFLDEMICKTSILYTAKHIDLDISNPATERFREAMQHDMDIDFDRHEPVTGPGGIGLLGHETKLDMFENLTAGPKQTADLTEKVQEPPSNARPKPEPSQKAPVENDDLGLRVDSLIETLRGHTKSTLPQLTNDEKFRAFTTEVAKSNRNPLIVKLRDAVTAAVLREP